MNREKRREKIYNKTDGHCYYCGCELPERWHADHVKPVRRKGKWERDRSNDPNSHKYVHTGESENPERDTIENKVPSCPRCNLRKSTLSIESFRKEISKQVERLKRDSSAFRLALDYGLIDVTGNDVEFYFEE